MNKLFIIGNLTRDPELRTTRDGTQVCSFTVAVNRRQKRDGQQEADFFRVTAWRELGANCGKFLQKGRKVAVTGPVSVSTYTGNDGATRATLELQAQDVEFLSPRASEILDEAMETTKESAPKRDAGTGYEQVDIDEELPF